MLLPSTHPGYAPDTHRTPDERGYTVARACGPKWHKGQQLWYARVGERDRTGRRRAVYMTRSVGDPLTKPPRGHRDEAQAWRWLEAYRAETEARIVDPRNPTVWALVELYLEYAKRRVAAGTMAAAHYEARRRHLGHLVGFAPPGGDPLADRRALELTPRILTLAVEDWGRDYAPHYVRDIVSSILTAYHWAARPGSAGEGRLIPVMPLDGFRRPTIPRFDGRYIETVEARRFLRWCWFRSRRARKDRRDSGRLAVLLLQFVRLTGCRPGEACKLTWDDINWEDGRIDLTDHKTVRYGKARTIYLTPAVSRILRAIDRQENRHHRLVFPRTGKGSPWDSTALAARLRAWRKEAKAAGLDFGKMTAYWLRHSYITDALLNGGSYADVAKMAGNSPAVLESVYDHPVHAKLAERADELARKRRADKQPRQSGLNLSDSYLSDEMSEKVRK